MVDSGQNPQDHFIKQRRNLIFVSLFIIFYEVGNLTIDEINFLGNKSTVGNPEIITFTLSLAFIYFFWRYFSACEEVGGIGRFFSACSLRAERKCEIYLKKKYFRTLNIAGKADLIYRTRFTRTYRTPIENPEKHTYSLEDIKLGWKFCFYYFKSILPILLKTSTFTEYILPYVLAIIAGLELLDYSLISHFIKP